MNVIFISPHFPHTYWQFCQRLRQNGAIVLGIGDCPQGSLPGEVRSSLDDYYYVPNMQNYPDMYKAVAFFAWKYGKIDWIESNNEFWLETDARLRTDFHVTTGVGAGEISDYKQKSAMKRFYRLAGVPTARQSMVTDIESARRFIGRVSYPVIVKPDVGVGANHTYKLSSDDELVRFFKDKDGQSYVMEEFVSGSIYSYDAIVNSKGEVLFESSSVFPPSMMEIVHGQLELSYCVLKNVPSQLRRRGRATLKAFGVKSRFIHFEFFRLDADKKGLGRKGDFIGLEVNMRPAGGYTPDMMDWAHSTDVYEIWADMVCFDENRKRSGGDDHFCLYLSRRDRFHYRYSSDEVLAACQGHVAMHERMPEAIADDLGNEFFILHARTKEEIERFTRLVWEKA